MFDDRDDSGENAQTLAETGAKLGAAAGSRAGPVATGLTSGFGGAVGYLAGSVLDDVGSSLRGGAMMTDGGQASDQSTTVEIPVSEEGD